MNRLTTLLTALFLVALVARANASDRSGVEISAGLFGSIPNDDLANIASSGVAYQFGFGVYPLRNFAIGFEVGGSSYGLLSSVKESIPYYDESDIEHSFGISRFVGYAKFYTSRNDLSPYIKIGAGSFSVSVESKSPTIGDASESQSDFGVIVGSGIDFQFSPELSGLIEISNLSFTSQDKIGIGSFQIGAGLALRFGGN